jgi:hypothetical protein
MKSRRSPRYGQWQPRAQPGRSADSRCGSEADVRAPGRSTDMGEFLKFEENAVDLGNAPHHDIQPPA